ncbi:hypothetical protein jhhlp_005796 [Lomentospora prolificans]|uniref:Zn(2)-C6 fungal-type domain-containing protein n=1 Tax=Lomentospora prolificans TaxID=41688 RepID=A0A2N3N437_9PEZI|nr:hypothetical protein jhhlp_005796 [Lomentospora prolificans]
MEQELSCSETWSTVNIEDTIGIADNLASIVTSGVLSGEIPEVRDSNSHGVVVKEPLGVVLGIAPWNAPLILGLRAVGAAVAAGNTAIFKGSELSPRTHYLLASCFREAGFPPGVCNFTGSTVVGRHIAMRAAAHLKPVLLELGGKNFAIVLEDADLDKAAQQILLGAFLNTGQICMSTDLALVHRKILPQLSEKLRALLPEIAQQATAVINARGRSRIEGLVKDAEAKGATVSQSTTGATVLEGVTSEMNYWNTESFGPLVGVRGFDEVSEAVGLVNQSDYGLSAAIFTRNHLKGLNLGKTLNVGAIHINAMTVHDEPTLPHGGYKESGFCGPTYLRTMAGGDFLAVPPDRSGDGSPPSVAFSVPDSEPNNREGEDHNRPPKRRRVTVACSNCRFRKSRCDGTRPKCTTCLTQGLECVYTHPGPLSAVAAAKGHLDSLEYRLAAVESRLQAHESRLGVLEYGRNGTNISPAEQSDTATEQRLPDASVDDDEPQSVVCSVDATDGVGSISFTEEQSAGFFGPSSNIAFTRDIVSATISMLKKAGAESVPSRQDSGFMQSHVLFVSRPPSPIPHQTRRLSRLHGSSLNPFELPPPAETLGLIHQYFANTGLLFPFIHRESFIQTYHEVAASNFSKVRRSWLGLLNMILAMSISTAYPSDLPHDRRRAESNVFFHRAMALCENQIRFGASLEIVQFLLLLSQYLQGTESSIQTWNIHGLAVKASYQLGLHSRHTLERYTPLEQEMRIRVLELTIFRRADIAGLHAESPSPDHTPSSDVVNMSVEFYNATIALYLIMGRVLDSLYGSNLDCETSEDVFRISSQIFQVEHQLSEAQRGFPPTMRPVEVSDILLNEPMDESSLLILKFRVVFTLRYHNIRILTHRPLLQKYLEVLSNEAQDSTRRVYVDPLRQENRVLLGAWWFSLYYTFNSALVIYSSLLIKAYAELQPNVVSLGDVAFRRDLLHQAIECLMSLDHGNVMTEKCARYTMKLDRVLDALNSTTSADMNGTGEISDVVSRPEKGFMAALMDPSLFNHGQTPTGLDLSEFMVPGDLDFLNFFDPNANSA